MAQRFFNPAPQYFYSGTPAAPLAGGLMYFYISGTDTPKDTYSDNGLSIPNSNPVVLSSSGLLPNVFLDGAYKVILTDKNGVQQPGWPRDSVNSVIDIAFSAWDGTVTYGEGGTNIVYASNEQYYVSIQANNTAHEPSISPLWWKPAFDYFAVGQLAVWAGEVFIGDATTGVAGVDINTKGSLLVGNGTLPVELEVGMDGLALLADSGAPEGVAWTSLAVLTTTVTFETFNASDTKVLPANLAFIFYTIVAGGAGGGGGDATPRAGGGGAGGQVKTGFFTPVGNLTITVGAGGAGGTSGGGAGADGSNSVLTDGTTTITAAGGGQATGNNNGVGLSDALVQCGGGGAGAGGPGANANILLTGTNGWLTTNATANTGNIGGWGAADAEGTQGGNGGPGVFCGLSNAYYGGGGGGAFTTPGVGRAGGGNGSATTGSAGTANTGGGGGGSYNANAGGAGGSGKVILAYFVVTP